jgi:hypothetical protein
MEKTTIQIDLSTLERLKLLKNYERQSYDELLNNLIDNSDDEFLSDSELEDIKVALENVKQGKVKSIEQIAKELSLKLPKYL